MKSSTILIVFAATATYFCEVVGLSCYHCVHWEGGSGGRTPPSPPPRNNKDVEDDSEGQDKHRIPVSSLCKNNPKESFLVNCDSLNYKYIDIPPPPTRKVGILNETEGSGSSTTTLAAVEEATQHLKFTCAKFLFEGDGGAGLIIRTCIPTTRVDVGCNESCAAGTLQELQEGQVVENPEIGDFLKLFNDEWFAGDAWTLASTCNGDGCNGPWPSVIYNQCDYSPPSSNWRIGGGSGSENDVLLTVSLVAMLIILTISFTRFIG